MRPHENLNPVWGCRLLLDLGFCGKYGDVTGSGQYLVGSDHSADSSDSLDCEFRCDLGDLFVIHGFDWGVFDVALGNLLGVDQTNLDSFVLEHGLSFFSRVSL